MGIHEPLREIGYWFFDLVPKKLRFQRPSFNFILVHYCYMIGMAIIGSILLYPAGVVDYIDALFFAAGAATQSGLNTINVNNLHLYQQLVLFFWANVCNPIFINTVVVFVRLHWFEKRFQHVVKEAHSARHNKTRSRSKSQMKDDGNPSRLESGVHGREIRVLHETTKPNGMSGNPAPTPQEEKALEKLGLHQETHSVEPTPEGSNQSTASTSAAAEEEAAKDMEKRPQTPRSPNEPHHLGLHPTLTREIKFADEVESPREHGLDRQMSGLERIPEQKPEQKDVSHHITFLQRQQKNAKEGGTLRIPGPRDFERGEKPQELDDDDGNHVLSRSHTRNTLTTITSSESERDRSRSMSRKSDVPSNELNGDDHPVKRSRGITIDEPQHPRRTRRSSDVDGGDENADGGRFQTILRKVTSPIHHKRPEHQQSAIGRTFSNFTTARSVDKMEEAMPYLSWQPTIGRNSAFIGLTEEQREELGGIEYRALKTLRNILLAYFVGFHILGMTVLLPWIKTTARWRSIVIADGTNPGWWGVFTPASMFNDLGFTLTPDSMNSFQTAALPLLFGSFLIIIGNTGFPCMLRFVIWVCSKCVTVGTPIWEELRFLLDHPRRCFTLLFPSKATWWLFWILVALNAVDLIFFIILDLNDETVTSIPAGYRVVAGWFQAASTRTAGFSCVNLAELHPAIQVSYMIMMYISVFPIAISVRRTNVYEEKSLGVWGGEEEGDETDPSYVGQHLRRQLSFDLWYVFLGFFIICIVEGPRLADNTKYAFTMFAVLFEIVSAYGTVGLSLGYPTNDASFSAEFATLSKLVIIAMMIRGRHRGLPYALDRAILLPSENLHKSEAEDALKRAGTVRRNSIFSEHGGAETALESFRRTGTWKDHDLDASGLPIQRRHHTATTTDDQHTATDTAMTAGAGGDDDMAGMTPAPGLHRNTTGISFAAEPTRQRHHQRRGSGMSTASAMTTGAVGEGGRPVRHTRGRSLSRLVASGLSAGPTFSKYED